MQTFPVARISEIPEQTGQAITLKGWEIALFHLSGGVFYAVENRCPHKEGPLAEGIISGKYVFCPLHDWKIDTTNGQVQEPDTGCVRSFPVEVSDDRVYIGLTEEEIQTA